MINYLGVFKCYLWYIYFLLFGGCWLCRQASTLWSSREAHCERSNGKAKVLNYPAKKYTSLLYTTCLHCSLWLSVYITNIIWSLKIHPSILTFQWQIKNCATFHWRPLIARILCLLGPWLWMTMGFSHLKAFNVLVCTFRVALFIRIALSLW